MTPTEFKEEMKKIGFTFDPKTFGWHRSDGSLASQEAIEDVCNIFSEKVQTFILEGWRKGVNQQFDIRFEDKDVIVSMRDANTGLVKLSTAFKATDVIFRP